VFAKLASELKKPDAVTVISRENYNEIVHPLPVGALLFVGGATERALHSIGVRTIGELAQTDEKLLIKILGKRGRQLGIYARGEDEEPVHWQKSSEDLKSIGNSMTLPQDIYKREDVKRWLYALSESVSARQRAADVGKANTVHLVVRNDKLQFFSWQKKVSPTALCGDIAKAAYALFCQHYPLGAPVRLLGVSVSGFDHHIQQLFLEAAITTKGEMPYEKKERAENAVAKIREKYGYAKLQRGVVMEEEKLNGLDIRGKKEEVDLEKNK
jgi:DNA polymerase-4